MKIRFVRFLLPLAVFFVLVPYWSFATDDVPMFRISVENAPTHVQTRAVRRFAELLEQRTRGRLRVEFYDNAELYRDRDVIGALHAGRVDMAVPGTWQIDRFEPSVAIFLLPTFYGRPASFVHDLSDGPLGREISRRIERTLAVRIPGRWLDLGHGQLYFTETRVRSYRHLDGLEIRVAGGIANELRIERLGADVRTIAWGDLPAHLLAESIDGLLTTHETVRSASLWEYGVRFCYEDDQYFPQYVPMIRGALWERLSEDIRSIIVLTWDEIVDEQREEAGEAQRRARERLVEEGIRISTASENERKRARALLKASEEEMAATIGIDRGLLERLEAALGER